MHGWSLRAASEESDVIGKRLEQVFPGADLRVVGRAVESAIDAGASTLLTNALHAELLPLRTRAGRPLLHDIVISPVGDAPGRQCVVQIADVTDTTRRERSLRDRQNARYDALVQSAPDVILNVDSQGDHPTRKPCGRTAVRTIRGAELVGKQMTLLFEREDGLARRLDVRGLRNRVQPPRRGTSPAQDGTLRYFEVSAARWQDGTRAFVTAILRDVTDRRDADIASETASVSPARTRTR